MDDTCQTKEVQPIFPSPEELWAKYRAESGITEAAEKMLAVPYYYREGMHEPRYYQWIAVNRVLTAIANGKRRALIVLATGTGKTLVAFQIIWRLLEARKVQRVLFLADRDVLVSQPMRDDFSPFGNKMTRITNRIMDTTHEVYLSLYHQMKNGAENYYFCEDIPHAERMKTALTNENTDLVVEQSYIAQITARSGETELLDDFTDPHEPFPVIAVTSRLMSTGVNTQTCKVVALDRTVNSMTEFKQIIGRGTRVREDCDKMYFTIMDFRKNYIKFADPAFDGEPVKIKDVGEEDDFGDDEEDTDIHIDPEDGTDFPDDNTSVKPRSET